MTRRSAASGLRSGAGWGKAGLAANIIPVARIAPHIPDKVHLRSRMPYPFKAATPEQAAHGSDNDSILPNRQSTQEGGNLKDSVKA